MSIQVRKVRIALQCAFASCRKVHTHSLSNTNTNNNNNTTYHHFPKIPFAVRHSIIHEMTVLGHRCGLVDQRWIRRGILRFQTLNCFDIAGIGNDDRELLELFDLAHCST